MAIKAETDKINAKVSEGKITQEKADAMIAKIKERIGNWDDSLKPLEKQHNKSDSKANLKEKSKTNSKVQIQDETL